MNSIFEVILSCCFFNGKNDINNKDQNKKNEKLDGMFISTI
ncbi:hypothetical protein DVDV_1099 [Desulfovibrio sp. DV]|nr:hypothetical protein DVDV_1099 [Desulfovibrio sp. DV]